MWYGCEEIKKALGDKEVECCNSCHGEQEHFDEYGGGDAMHEMYGEDYGIDGVVFRCCCDVFNALLELGVIGTANIMKALEQEELEKDMEAIKERCQ
jgi:hypothetical protein